MNSRPRLALFYRIIARVEEHRPYLIDCHIKHLLPIYSFSVFNLVLQGMYLLSGNIIAEDF